MTSPDDPNGAGWGGPGPLFWLAMAFAAACLIAAAAVAVRFGVFAHRAPSHAAPPAVQAARPSRGAGPP